MTLKFRKKDFLENTLEYTNQAAISTIKCELSVYFQNFTFSQVNPLQNPPPNLEEYCFRPNEVKRNMLKETLAYIMLRSDQDEVFFFLWVFRRKIHSSFL